MSANPLTQSSPVLRTVDRFWRCESGVNAIEFAFVMPFVVAILLVTTQIAVIFIAQSYLETVAENAMRLVMTNQAQSGNMTQAQFQTAVCQNVVALFNCNSSNMMIVLETAPTCPASNLAQCQTNMAAATPTFDPNTGKLTTTLPYQLTSMTVGVKGMLMIMYQWPVIGGPLGLNFSNLGNGAYLLVATQVFQVEPPTT